MRASFEEEDNELIAQVKDLMAKRAELAAGLPDNLLALYDKTAAKSGGVAVGQLTEDAHCGICRASIEGGRLIELRASAPLGTCPNCKRLLVVK